MPVLGPLTQRWSRTCLAPLGAFLEPKSDAESGTTCVIVRVGGSEHDLSHLGAVLEHKSDSAPEVP